MAAGVSGSRPCADQFLGDPSHRAHGHQEHQRIDAGQRAPVQAALVPVGFVARNDRDRGGGIPVRDRDARAHRSGERGRHAGDHFEWNSVFREKLGLFASPAE